MEDQVSILDEVRDVTSDISTFPNAIIIINLDTCLVNFISTDLFLQLSSNKSFFEKSFDLDKFKLTAVLRYDSWRLIRSLALLDVKIEIVSSQPQLLLDMLRNKLTEHDFVTWRNVEFCNIDREETTNAKNNTVKKHLIDCHVVKKWMATKTTNFFNRPDVIKKFSLIIDDNRSNWSEDDFDFVLTIDTFDFIMLSNTASKSNIFHSDIEDGYIDAGRENAKPMEVDQSDDESGEYEQEDHLSIAEELKVLDTLLWRDCLCFVNLSAHRKYKNVRNLQLNADHNPNEAAPFIPLIVMLDLDHCLLHHMLETEFDHVRYMYKTKCWERIIKLEDPEKHIVLLRKNVSRLVRSLKALGVSMEIVTQNLQGDAIIKRLVEIDPLTWKSVEMTVVRAREERSKKLVACKQVKKYLSLGASMKDLRRKIIILDDQDYSWSTDDLRNVKIVTKFNLFEGAIEEFETHYLQKEVYEELLQMYAKSISQTIHGLALETKS